MHIKGFLRLIKKYRDGDLPNEKRELMDRWYDAMGGQAEDLTDKDQIKEKIWVGILSKSDRGGKEAEPARLRWVPEFLRVAGVALLLIAGGIYYFDRNLEEARFSEALPETGDWVRIDNTSQESREVRLADSSRAVLEPGSVLQYPREFAPERRIVHMKGNVFFEVKKDPGRPFLAYAGDVQVEVLGTSFIIKEVKESKATEVSVITGKVVVEKAQSVKEQKRNLSKDNRIVLTPNKKVTFFQNGDHYVTGLVDNPVLVDKSDEFVKPEAFDFDEVPLARILEKLEKAYGVSIAVSDQGILNCLITADLSSNNLYGKVEVISAILNADYEIKGSSILLSDGVCKELEK